MRKSKQSNYITWKEDKYLFSIPYPVIRSCECCDSPTSIGIEWKKMFKYKTVTKWKKRSSDMYFINEDNIKWNTKNDKGEPSEIWRAYDKLLDIPCDPVEPGFHEYVTTHPFLTDEYKEYLLKVDSKLKRYGKKKKKTNRQTKKSSSYRNTKS